jgi:ornithine--oxo-acid transaminase
LKALIEQAQRLTFSSRAFHNDKFPIFAEYLTSMFGYEMMLPMNTGAEGNGVTRRKGYQRMKYDL